MSYFPARRTTESLVFSAAALLVLSCGTAEPAEVVPIAPGTPSSATPSTTAPAGLRITEVIFARELDEQWQPIGGAQVAFPADQETVWARVTLDGRPRTGVITLRWMWREFQLAAFPIDLSTVNGGVLFSFGTDTYLQGYVTPNQTFYIGAGHRLVLMAGGAELGSYGFTVVPPAGARPSRFVSAELYNADPRQGDPGPHRTVFAPAEHVYVAGQVALGKRSWFNCTVAINGVAMPAMTREIIGPDDGGDVLNFAMDMFPEGGWPPGQHRIALILDDHEVATYDLRVEGP